MTIRWRDRSDGTPSRGEDGAIVLDDGVDLEERCTVAGASIDPSTACFFVAAVQGKAVSFMRPSGRYLYQPLIRTGCGLVPGRLGPFVD